MSTEIPTANELTKFADQFLKGLIKFGPDKPITFEPKNYIKANHLTTDFRFDNLYTVFYDNKPVETYPDDSLVLNRQPIGFVKHINGERFLFNGSSFVVFKQSDTHSSTYTGPTPREMTTEEINQFVLEAEELTPKVKEELREEYLNVIRNAKKTASELRKKSA